MARWLTALFAATALALAAPASAQQSAGGAEGQAAEPVPAAEPRTSIADIEDEVMCPICGVTLELAIDAPQAQQERAFIRELIAQGLTKEEIKDRLVDEFGSEVLAVPEAEGFDLAAWLVPGLAILAAAVGIGFGLRRWRKAGGRGDGGSAEPGEDRLSDEDEKRLDADLARYDL
jgi:cytochrome c-type biogenesis protein CcmH